MPGESCVECGSELGQAYDPPIRCDACCGAHNGYAAAERHFSARVRELEAEIARLRRALGETTISSVEVMALTRAEVEERLARADPRIVRDALNQLARTCWSVPIVDLVCAVLGVP